VGFSDKFAETEEDTGIDSNINITPLVDIMLVLLIIFMATTTIASKTDLGVGPEIDLPEQVSETKKVGIQEKLPVIISFNKSGELFIQGAASAWESFEEDLKMKLTENGSDWVIFEGDRASNLGAVVKIIDMAKRAGATNFALASLVSKE
jgi:biopolymer transport protein ExbD